MADEQEVNFNVCAVIPAAGCGLRTGLPIPKQFNIIHGRPLISYTLQAFECVSWVQEIIVPVSGESQQHLNDILMKFGHKKVRLTLGGKTRHRSISNGVNELSSSNSQVPDVLIIHDAVRPFVDEEILKKVALAANEFGACGAVRPLVSTVIAANKDGFLDHSLERSKYRASEMPQAFRFDAIHEAYSKCSEYDFEFGTECLHLAQTYSGVKVKLVEGPDSLWKVTYKKDLAAAEAVIKESIKHKALVIGSNEHQLEKDLVTRLQSNNVEVVYACKTSEMKKTSNFNVVVNICSKEHEDTIDNMLSYMKQSSNDKRTVVIVKFLDDKSFLTVFKEQLKNWRSRCRSLGIQCFGVFVDTSCCTNTEIMSNDCQDIITLIVDTALNTSHSFTGQVFEYLW